MVILSDLSEVLIRGMYGIEEPIGKRYGRKVAKRFLKRRSEIDTIFEELMRGHLSEDVYWQVFFQEGKWPFDKEEIKSLFSLNLAQNIPGTLEVYQKIKYYPATLQADDFVMGRPEIWLVSDHIAERENEIGYLHPEIFTLCSRILWSFNSRALKSDTGFFQNLLSSHHLDHSEVVFIDDMPKNIMAASSGADIMSIRFFHAAQLQEDLCKLGFGFEDPVATSPTPQTHQWRFA